MEESDERLYTDLRRGQGYTGELEKINRNDSSLTLTITLKQAATKKMKLRVIGYYQGEYLYTYSSQGILSTFKDYSIIEQNKMVELAAWKQKKWKKLFKRINRLYNCASTTKKAIKNLYIQDGKFYLSGGKIKQKT